MANSHYLEKDRLANVIAAIQILGLSEQTSASLDRWIAELEASEELTPRQLDHTPVKFADRKKWGAVFEQHPEFFKSYTLHGDQRVLLRWRYAQSLNVWADVEAAPAPEDAEPDNADEDVVLNSPPLGPDQIQVLIETAMAFHAKEAEAARIPDRVSPLAMAAVGAALGTIVGGIVVVVLGWVQIAQMTRIFD